MQRQILLGLRDSEGVFRYYYYYSDKMWWRNRIATGVTLLSASGAISVLTLEWPVWISIPLWVVTALMAIWDSQMDHAGKATAAGMFADRYRELTSEWRSLFYRGQPTQGEIDTLRSKFDGISAGYNLPLDTKLNKKGMREADGLIKSEFGEDALN